VSELVNHLLDHADFLRFRVCNYTNLERGLANDMADDCQKAARQLVAHDALVKAARDALDTLRRCKEIVDDLECECDEYHGFTCSIHRDREMVDAAISQVEAALAAVDGGGQ
jgi:hypothetical protein